MDNNQDQEIFIKEEPLVSEPEEEESEEEDFITVKTETLECKQELPKEVIPEVLQCSKCRITYFSRDSYRNHVVSCQGIIVTFPTAGNNNNSSHEDLRNSIKILERSCFGAEMDEDDPDGHETSTHFCGDCQESFSSEVRFARHVYAHTFVKQPLEDHGYICPDCGKDFHGRTAMDRHLKRRGGTKCIHEPKVVFPCGICQQLFTRKDNLRSHLQVHAGAPDTRRKYDCKKCGKIFGGFSLLSIHRRSHGNVKQYACGRCNKTFAGKSSLEKHERRHTGERPFGCNICTSSFTTLEGLNRHNMSHGREPISSICDERPKLKCDQCAMTFSSQGHLECHKNSHSDGGFRCYFCPTTFTFLYKLDTHMKFVHPEALRPKCEDCGQEEISHERLKMHVQIMHSSSLPRRPISPVESVPPQERVFSFPTSSNMAPKTYKRKRKLPMVTIKTEEESQLIEQVKLEPLDL